MTKGKIKTDKAEPTETSKKNKGNISKTSESNIL